MKRYLLVFFLLGISFSQYGQSYSTDALAESQIRMVMEIQEKAWNRGDIPSYMQGYWNSDSLLFIGRRGPTYGWSKTLTNYLKSYPNKEKMGELSFTILKIELIGKTEAFVVGKWHLQRKEDAPHGYFSLFWRKIDDEWKIVADHSSSAESE